MDHDASAKTLSHEGLLKDFGAQESLANEMLHDQGYFQLISHIDIIELDKCRGDFVLSCIFWFDLFWFII